VICRRVTTFFSPERSPYTAQNLDRYLAIAEAFDAIINDTPPAFRDFPQLGIPGNRVTHIPRIAYGSLIDPMVN
jgi:hypothetical protein